MTEEWKDIFPFGGVYQISNLGRVRRAVHGAGGSYAGKIIANHIDRFGYKVASFFQGGKSFKRRVHVKMLETFVGPRPRGHDASHKNGIKTDNRLENLCWETSSENNRRKFAHGTLVHGEKHKCSKLKSHEVIAIRHAVAQGTMKSELADIYGVSRTLIGYIVSGRAWPHLDERATS